MGKTVAYAKTTRPCFGGVLRRERLYESIDRRFGWGQCGVIWVAGPAGAGKTTLVASYLEARAGRSIWYQLDAGDEHVGTFFYHLRNAALVELERTGDGGGVALPVYSNAEDEPLEDFARRFFRSLYAQLGAAFYLVLDNYQDVPSNCRWQQVLELAVTELPAEGRLLVLSRAEPPAQLARLRANRQLEVLGWTELRLTRSESDTLIERFGAPGSEYYLERLYERTAGWAAGLILMLDREDGGFAAREVDPSAPQVLFDYLAGEILDNFDAPTRHLLLMTAQLPEMTAAMAVEMSGEPRAGEMLAELHHNYHLIGRRPGPDAPLYHYHPLLAETLQARLRQSLSAPERRELRRRTVVCLESQGAVVEAVRLGLQAADWDEVARLIGAHGEILIGEGRTEAVEAWLEQLPEDHAHRRPELQLFQAICRRASGSLREARLSFERAFQAFAALGDDHEPGAMRALAGLLDTIVEDRDDFGLLDPWIDAAHRRLPAADADVADGAAIEDSDRSRVELLLSTFRATSLRFPGHPALAAMRTAVRGLAREPGDRVAWFHHRACAHLACDAARRAQWQTARQYLESLRVYTLEQENAGSGENLLSLMGYLWEWADALGRLHDFDGLQALLEACGCLQGEVRGDTRFGVEVQGLLAALGQGRKAAAVQLVDRLNGLSVRARRLDRGWFHYACGWLQSLEGESLAAGQELRTASQLAAEAGSPALQDAVCAARVELRLASVSPTAMRTELRRARRLASVHRDPAVLAQVQLAHARAALNAGQMRLGRRVLAKALEFARVNDLHGHHWWHRAHAAELCAQALRLGIEPEFARLLVRTHDLAPPAEARHIVEWPWRFHIYCLGRFRILRDGKPLGLTARLQQKPLALLRMLIAMGGTRVPERKLAAALWPRIDEDSALKSLTTTLHRLRKLLGEDQAVLLRFGRLSLNERYCWTDVGAFESLTTAADSESWHASDPGAARPAGSADAAAPPSRSVAGEIASIYRGPFLAEHADDRQFQAMRQRLRNRLLRAAGELIRAWTLEADWQSCFDFLRRAIEAEPELEGLYRRLMLSYRDAGLVTEAMDVYEQYREVCRGTDTGEPSAETTAVFNLVLKAL